MERPKHLKASQLAHPKDQRSKFNGAKLRNEKTFNHRVSTVEGTNPPSNSRAVSAGAVGDYRDITGAVRPIPLGHQFEPFTRPLEDLKEHQVKQLTDLGRKKSKKR